MPLANHKNYLKPFELQLISSYDLVEVEPLSSIRGLSLISGSLPECEPLSITKLPFFVALPLKNSNCLQIRLPSYLSKDYLKEKIEEEEKNRGEYSFLPESIFVTGKEIVKNSYNAEDVPHICSLIDRLKVTRFRKTLEGVEGMDGSTLNLNNLTVFEFNEVKELMRGSMELMKRL